MPLTNYLTRTNAQVSVPDIHACCCNLLALTLLATPRSAASQLDDLLAAVRATVERANSAAVWGEALRSGDPAALTLVWWGEPLTYFSGEVLAYRDRGLRLLSRLVDLEFLDTRLVDDNRAEVETRERWADQLCTDDGELRAARAAEVRDRYELTWRDGAWWVTGVDVELTGGTFDWQPASDPPDPPSPCAAVLR